MQAIEVTREKMRIRHMACLRWIRQYVTFHERRHPREPGTAEVGQFLAHLAAQRKVGARARPGRR